MRAEKFKVIDFIREIIVDVDKEMDNFPKKDIEIKNRIRSNTYDLLELAYKANASLECTIKQQLILEMLAKVKLIDFLLNLSFDKRIITSKKYFKLANKLDNIVKYATGWLNKVMTDMKNEEN